MTGERPAKKEECPILGQFGDIATQEGKLHVQVEAKAVLKYVWLRLED